MRVVLLGTGGTHPSEQRHTACVLLPELGLALDAGSAAFRLHGRVPTPRLDIVLTHAHLDHVAGLPSLLGLRRVGGQGPGGLVEIVAHGSAATLAAVEGLLLTPPLFPLSPLAATEELRDGFTTPAGARVTVLPLEHPGGSLGVRVDHGGKSLAYLTDTTPIAPALRDRVRGVDLLLHEASFDESQREMAARTGHCTGRQAAEVAAAVAARRLVLVHVDPRGGDEATLLAEARALFPGAEIGRDGAELVVEAPSRS